MKSLQSLMKFHLVIKTSLFSHPLFVSENCELDQIHKTRVVLKVFLIRTTDFFSSILIKLPPSQKLALSFCLLLSELMFVVLHLGLFRFPHYIYTVFFVLSFQFSFHMIRNLETFLESKQSHHDFFSFEEEFQYLE